MVGMVIKPMDILLMLDSEDVDQMEYIDLRKLCIVITLDEQLTQESIARNESSNNRRNLC
jgi:hypothetical protein